MMKKFLLSLFILSLGGQPADAGESKRANSNSSSKKEEKSAESKKTSHKKQKKPRLKTKKRLKKSSRRLTTKESFLPSDYYKPKKTAKELSQEFDRHIQDLKTVCEIKENQSKVLTEKLKDLQDFLKTSLKDPYMNYKLKLEFGDLLDIMEDNLILDLNDFVLSYRLLYNLPENTKQEDYYHSWAQDLFQILKCVKKTNDSNNTKT